MRRIFFDLNEAVYKTPADTVSRLQILAPLPTAKPESAGLCALGSDSIVVRSLTNQRSGLATRTQVKGASAFQASLRICIFAISSWWLYAGDLRVCRVPLTGSLTRVQPPPSLFSDRLSRLHFKGASP